MVKTTNTHHFARTLILSLYGLLFSFSTVVIGQTTLDLDPPEVVHVVPTKVVPGKALRVDANITDDSGIDQVTVHYRERQGETFTPLEMTNLQGDEYTALLTTTKELKTLQYYIEVLDAGGNRVLEGGPSSPLTIEAKARTNMLYVVLGVVAVGALVGLAGGDDSGPIVEPPVGTLRTLSITAPVPE